MASAGALAAPSIARAKEGAGDPRVLTFIPHADLIVLDPIFTPAYISRNHAMLVFDMLYGMDTANRVQPQMAAGHRVEDDGKTWLITLRDGLAWHDGEKVLARDCVASIKRWGARDSFGQTLMAVTEALDAPDDRTIRFRLKRPFPLLAAALGKAGSNLCVMMPERLAKTPPFTQVTEVIGSGPFRYLPKDRVPGSLVAYERNAAYVPRPDGVASFTAGPKVVHVDRVEWHVMPDAATSAAAMQTGEIDWWEAPSFDLLPTLARLKTLTIPPPEPAGYMSCLRLNHTQKPFNNPALRRALLGAVNQEDYMAALAGSDRESWNAAAGVFCPASPMASPAGMEVLTSPRDPEAVKRAILAAGYQGERTVLVIPTDLPALKTLGEVGLDMMRRAGLAVEPNYMDWGTMLKALSKTGPVEDGGWSAFHTVWSGLDEYDPAVHSYIRGNGAAGARGWPVSPKLEALREAWLFAAGDAERKAIAADIQRQVFVDVPYIPVGQFAQRTVYQSNITDVLTGYALFWNLKKG